MLEGSASNGLLSHHRDQHPRCCSAHPGSLSGILVGGCPGTPSFCSAAPPRRPLPAASHFCTRRPPRTLSHVPILPCAAFPSSLRFSSPRHSFIFGKGPARPCRSLPQPERVHFHSFPAPRAPFRNLPFETARIQHLHTLPITLLDCFCLPLATSRSCSVVLDLLFACWKAIPEESFPLLRVVSLHYTLTREK